MVAPAESRVLVDRERALAQAFGPGATIRTRTVFLDSMAVRRAEQAAGAKLASPRVVRYEATRRDTLLGTAYLDTHRVRSMNETVMIVVSPAGRVGAVETLAFAEPDDYLAPRRWLARFEDQALSRDLKPGDAVPNLGGSTLTARAIAAAVRRTLALHAVIAEKDRGARK
jgi:electron transport complex protein RnfG